MTKATGIHHSLCFLGIVVFVWSYSARPGIYYGSLNGLVTMLPPEEAETYHIYCIQFSSHTKPRWEWAEPNNFRYAHVDLTINDKTKVTVLLPSLTCKHGSEEKPFSRALLEDLITADSPRESGTITPERLNELFDFVLSAGKGTLPRPRHHPYLFESPYRATFTHFLLGGSGPIAILGVIVLATGILLRLIPGSGAKDAKPVSDRQHSRPGTSIVLVAILLNYGAFSLGMFLDLFGGAVDMFGAHLCQMSCIFGTLLIPVSIVYSFARRFVAKAKQWDCFGVYLSILSCFVLMLLLRTPPWIMVVDLMSNT